MCEGSHSEDERVCSRCGLPKPISCFYKTKNWRVCKTCIRTSSKASYEAHKEARLEYQRQRRNSESAADAEARKEYGRKRYYANKEAILKAAKEYRKTPEWAAWKKKRQALEKERRAEARPARLAAHIESMSAVCPACGILFVRKRRRNRYCSRKCGHEPLKRGLLLLKCDVCGKDFHRKPHEVVGKKRGKVRDGHYCSPECLRNRGSEITETQIEIVKCECGELLVRPTNSQKKWCKKCRRSKLRRENASLVATYGIEWVHALAKALSSSDHLETNPWHTKLSNLLASIRIRSRHRSGGERRKRKWIIESWTDAMTLADCQARSRANWQLANRINPWIAKFRSTERNWRRKIDGIQASSQRSAAAAGETGIQVRFDRENSHA